MTHVIFAVDTRIHRDIVEAKKVSNWLIGTLGAKVLLGAYKMRGTGVAVTELSFLLPENVFDGYVNGTGIVSKQESFLYVSECNKQYATLKFTDKSIPDEYLGCLKRVGRDEAMEKGEYSYDPITKQFFIVVANSQNEAPAERAARELWQAVDLTLNAIKYGSVSSLASAAEKLTKIRDEQRPRWL